MSKNWSKLLPNRLFDNKRCNQNYFILSNIECRYKSAESILSQKKGCIVNFSSIHQGLVVDAKKMSIIVTNRLLDNKRLIKIRLIHQTLNADTSLLC